ncbi:MAG TPA: exodeoxyribonuclease V subunit gamma, partial [Aliidiomarina sp.]|nr:exodeoxyribonuclease V subunit gamma [Aliidiomarina sp.]
QLLAALGQHRQVLLAVLNPCQHFWGDITTLKDQVRQQRHALKPAWANPDMQDKLYLNSPPLLASWGKQGRDYIDLLAQFDEPELYREWFGGRIDLFSDSVASEAVADLSILAQIQQDILSLNPVPAEKRVLGTTDQSVSFHRCHSRQREVEVLQDRLLQDFRDNPELRARDVIVMTPDISQYSPHVDAVFGGIDRDDSRYLSYSLADQQGRGQEPLLIALEYLLTVDQQQITLSEVLDILEVPAVQQRFQLEPAAVPQLRQWLSEAGVRWGIDTTHREKLGITSMDDAFSWAFGVERILLGYAMGEEVEWQNRLAYAEVAGLGAEQLGPVLSFIHLLREWFESIHQQPTRTLSDWLAALQGEEGLLSRCFDFSGDQESRIYTRLMTGLERLEAGALAGQFDGDLPLSILREAWLAEAEESGLSQRFMAGSVTFSTLLPMRAIPFKRIYVLGMNDGEYPRSRRPDDFDLMAGDYRPGDRSRRDDDRYLFLEALLSAREAVYYSWVGFNIQDNTERPPSVLIAQLMDLLEQGWQCPTGESPVAARLHDYPLQPFSSYYFGPAGLPTFGREWESLFQGLTEKPIYDSENTQVLEPETNQTELITLLKQPVDFYVQQRFKTRFKRQQDQLADNEPFSLDGLDNYILQAEALEVLEREGQVNFASLKNKWKKSAVLPFGVFGERAAAKVAEGLDVLEQRFAKFQSEWQRSQLELPKHISLGGVSIDTAFNNLWQNGDEFAFVFMRPSAIETREQLRWAKLLPVWVQMQLAASAGQPIHGYILGLDKAVKWFAPNQEEAQQNLRELLAFRVAASKQPLPINADLAAAIQNEITTKALETVYNGGDRVTGEVEKSVALQRYYPDFNRLAENDYEGWAQGIYLAIHNTYKEQV